VKVGGLRPLTHTSWAGLVWACMKAVSLLVEFKQLWVSGLLSFQSPPLAQNCLPH
jgi:hypothetical protein